MMDITRIATPPASPLRPRVRLGAYGGEEHPGHRLLFVSWTSTRMLIGSGRPTVSFEERRPSLANSRATWVPYALDAAPAPALPLVAAVPQLTQVARDLLSRGAGQAPHDVVGAGAPKFRGRNFLLWRPPAAHVPAGAGSVSPGCGLNALAPLLTSQRPPIGGQLRVAWPPTPSDNYRSPTARFACQERHGLSTTDRADCAAGRAWSCRWFTLPPPSDSSPFPATLAQAAHTASGRWRFARTFTRSPWAAALAAPLAVWPYGLVRLVRKAMNS